MLAILKKVKKKNPINFRTLTTLLITEVPSPNAEFVMWKYPKMYEYELEYN